MSNPVVCTSTTKLWSLNQKDKLRVSSSTQECHFYAPDNFLGRSQEVCSGSKTSAQALTGFLLNCPEKTKNKGPKTRLADPYGVKMRSDWLNNQTRNIYSHLKDRVLIPTRSRTVNRDASEYSNSISYRMVKGYIPLPHPETCRSYIDTSFAWLYIQGRSRMPANYDVNSNGQYDECKGGPLSCPSSCSPCAV